MSDVLNRYAKTGLAGSIEPGKKAALLVIDMQKGFTDATCQVGFTMPEVVDETSRLVAAAHDHDVPVFFTTIAFPVDIDPIWLMKMPAMYDLREGRTWTEIDPATGFVDTDQVIVKQAASGFSGTNLASQLEAAGVDTVIVCGATTSGCIRATVVDAISLGLRPFVVRGACGDRERSPHEAALVDIQGKYGEVVTLAEALSIFQEQV